jgi:hypothetical protein
VGVLSADSFVGIAKPNLGPDLHGHRGIAAAITAALQIGWTACSLARNQSWPRWASAPLAAIPTRSWVCASGAVHGPVSG